MLSKTRCASAGLATSTRHTACVPRPARAPAGRRSSIASRAAQPEEQPTTQAEAAAPAVLRDMQVSWDKFLQRYEHSMLSASVGAGAVTTWCMLHGQSPGEAATITVLSTITALVLNEVLFTDGQA